jgi:hypothetical protein
MPAARAARPATAPVRRPMSEASRYLVIPCEGDGHGDLAVIWDRLEEQVVDVIDAKAAWLADEGDITDG